MLHTLLVLTLIAIIILVIWLNITGRIRDNVLKKTSTVVALFSAVVALLLSVLTLSNTISDQEDSPGTSTYPIRSTILTGINHYPALSLNLLDSSLKDSVIQDIYEKLGISGQPLVYSGNAVFENIERFKNESQINKLMEEFVQDPGDMGLNYAVNKNDSTTEGSFDFQTSQDVESFESSLKRLGPDNADLFNYAPILSPLQLDGEDINYTALAYQNRSNNARYILVQYPKLGNIYDSYVGIGNFLQKGVSTQWLEKVIQANPQHRGIIGFQYPFVLELGEANLLYEVCGDNYVLDAIESLLASPYIKFVDIENESNSTISVDGFIQRVLEREAYELTNIDQRTSLIEEDSIKETEEIRGISLKPSQHLLIPTEFGFDTKPYKEILLTPNFEQAEFQENMDVNILVYRPLNEPLDKYRDASVEGLRQSTQLITIPSQYAKGIKSIEELVELVPRRFAVGSVLTIDSVRVNGRDIKIPAPVDEPTILVAEVFHAGSCPYLLFFNSEYDEWIEMGTVLYGVDSIDKKNSEIRKIPEGIAKIKIEERESEITYLDYITIGYKNPLDGKKGEAYLPYAELESIDGTYLSLKQGEFLEIDLDEFVPKGSEDLELLISGFYEVQ